jgi:hypothetical protein
VRWRRRNPLGHDGLVFSHALGEVPGVVADEREREIPVLFRDGQDLPAVLDQVALVRVRPAPEDGLVSFLRGILPVASDEVDIVERVRHDVDAVV